MSVLSSLTRIAKTDSKWYLLLGLLSLLKAVGVRHDSRRFRRELLDAGFFLGLGLLLRKVEGKRSSKSSSSSGSTSKTGSGASGLQSKVRSLRGDSADSGSDSSSGTVGGAKESLKDRFSTSDPEPDTTVGALIRRFGDGDSERSKGDGLRGRLSRS